MTKKNFRKLSSAPDAIIKCVGCGLKTMKSEVEKRHWYMISEEKDLYSCPNCDITILHREING